MSYPCPECGRKMPPGSQPIKVVTEQRRVIYDAVDADGKVVESTRGHETVREEDRCPRCVVTNPPSPVFRPDPPKHVVTSAATR